MQFADIDDLRVLANEIKKKADTAGLGTAASANTTNSISQGSGDLPTAGAVWAAIDNLPEPMIMKGTLGTGGTITSLPTASASNEGFVYKVITAGTYVGQAAVVGDFFVSCKPEGASAYSWVWFPSGDESFSDTWRNIKVNGTEKLGTGISSGAVDFVDGTNTTVAFDTNGNKVSVSVPAVSSSNAGVAPKGNAVSSQDQNTKFLREDGAWAKPSYTTDTNTHRPIQVNDTQVLGDNTTPLDLKAGSNVTISADGGNVTISAQDTTYSDATTSASGLMSASDKTKLNGIAANATKVEASETNGHIEIDDVDTTVYDDTAVTTAIDDLEDIVSTETTTVEGNPVSFNTLSAQNAESCEIELNPIQDLHGYDKPWVGGAGKNLLETPSIDPTGTDFTWKTISDNDGNIIGIEINGTASENTNIDFSQSLETNNTLYQNCILLNGSYTGTIRHISYDSSWGGGTATNIGTKRQLSSRTFVRWRIIVSQGANCNKAVFGMIVATSENADTYSPYTNICPISGRDQIKVLGCGKNILNPIGVSGINDGITYVKGADGKFLASGTNSKTTSATAYLAGEFQIRNGFTYSLNGCPANGSTNSYRLDIRTSNNEIYNSIIDEGNGATFTATENITLYVYMRFNRSYAISGTLEFAPMVRLASYADSIFEPYTQSNSIILNFRETVYGGQIDVENGVLTIDKKYKSFDGTESWTSSSSVNGRYIYVTGDGLKDDTQPLYSTHYPVGQPNESNVVYRDASVASLRIVYNTTYDTLTAWKNYLTEQNTNNTPVSVVYVLTTPIIIQLALHQIQLLEGANYISVDDNYSTITVTYANGKVATLSPATEDTDGLMSAFDKRKLDYVSGDSIYDNNKIVGSDTEPYISRKCLDVDKCTGFSKEKLVGGSVAVNQLVQNGDFSDGISNWSSGRSTLSVSNGVATISNITASLPYIEQSITCKQNHKYFVALDIKSNVAGEIRICLYSNNYIERAKINHTLLTSFNRVSGIMNCSSSDVTRFILVVSNTYTSSTTVDYKNVILIDLTQLFGATIADYVYSLEQASEGSGIAWLKSYGFFTKDYYPYNMGELISVKTSGKEVVGKNIYPVLIGADSWSPNQSGTYSNDNGTLVVTMTSTNNSGVYSPVGSVIRTLITSLSGQYSYSLEIKANNSGTILAGINNNGATSVNLITEWKRFTFTSTFNEASNSFRFYNASGQAMIIYARNLQFEYGSTATDYVPYTKQTYPVSPIDLRGLLKLDTNNKLYCDGDIYKFNGKVTRKYSNLVDAGSLDWIYNTSGDYPVFETINALSNAIGGGSIISSRYPQGNVSVSSSEDKVIGLSASKKARIKDTSYTDTITFKTAMSGVYFIYELETSTEEIAEPFNEIFNTEPSYTESFIDDRVFPIPVGHDTDYYGVSEDIFKVPTEPDDDGEYALTRSGLGYNWKNVDGFNTDTEDISGNPVVFDTMSEQVATECSVELKPIQDLHGYSKPWVGGAGKNLLPMTVDGIKAANSGATWTGNKCTIDGVEHTILTDTDNNVIGIKVYSSSASQSGNTSFNLCTNTTFQAGSYKITPNRSVDVGYINFLGSKIYTSATKTLESDATGTVKLVTVTAQGSAVDVIYYPVVCLSTETDASFQPYTNICPISGRTQVGIEGCGKNLIDFSSTEVGYIDANTGEEGASNSWRRTQNIYVKPNTKYVFSYYTGTSKLSSSTAGFAFYTSTGNYISGVLYINNLWSYDAGMNRYYYVITTPDNVSYIRISIPANSAYMTQFELDSVPTFYKTYTPSNSRSISLPETVYGGTLDVKTGKLVVDKKIVDLGDVSWNYNSSNKWFSGLASGSPSVAMDEKADMISDSYDVVSRDYIANNPTIDGLIAINTSPNILIRDLAYTDNTAFTTYVTGEKVVYKLATPQTYYLTPYQVQLLKGYNYISTNADEIDVTFRVGEMATLADIQAISNPLHQYSAVERQIGVDIDGVTPVYERIMVKTVNAEADWQLFDDDVSYQYLLEAKGYLIPTEHASELHPFTSTMFSEPRFYVNLSNHKLYVYTTNDRYGQVRVTVVYTKYIGA